MSVYWRDGAAKVQTEKLLKLNNVGEKPQIPFFFSYITICFAL